MAPDLFRSPWLCLGFIVGGYQQMTAALALSAVISLATTCIPDARLSHVRDRLVAHAMVESGHNPLAIHDNTAAKSHFPSDMAEAKQMLTSLNGHSVDVGIAQITRANWPRLGLSERNLFDPVANLCAGAVVLIQDYEVACRYNTGKPNCPPGNTYADAIDRAMRVISGSARPAGQVDIKEVGPQTPPCDAPKFDAWAQQACRDAGHSVAPVSVNQPAVIPCDAPSFDVWGQQACLDAAAATGPTKEPTE